MAPEPAGAFFWGRAARKEHVSGCLRSDHSCRTPARFTGRIGGREVREVFVVRRAFGARPKALKGRFGFAGGSANPKSPTRAPSRPFRPPVKSRAVQSCAAPGHLQVNCWPTSFKVVPPLKSKLIAPPFTSVARTLYGAFLPVTIQALPPDVLPARVAFRPFNVTLFSGNKPFSMTTGCQSGFWLGCRRALMFPVAGHLT